MIISAKHHANLNLQLAIERINVFTKYTPAEF